MKGEQKEKGLKTLRIDKDVHKRLKLYCVVHNLNISEYASRLIDEAIRGREASSVFMIPNSIKK